MRNRSLLFQLVCNEVLWHTVLLRFLLEQKMLLNVQSGPRCVNVVAVAVNFLPGVDEFYPEEDGVTVYAPYESFGAIQKWLDDKGYEIVSGESVYLPTDTKELDAEGRESIEKLVEKLEEDDDVTNVYHNMKEVDEE